MNISVDSIRRYLLVEHRSELKALGLYLAISLVMFWQISIHIFGSVVNGYGDVYQSMFNLWWVPYSIFVLHQSPYFTKLLFHPIGANLVTQTLTPIAGILSIPFQAVGSAFAYNVLFFSSFAFSGLFMFVLADHLVKNKHAAFIAGLIFAFSPMHIAQSYGHLDWTIIEWVPLFLYFYMRTLEDFRVRNALLAAVSFILLTFMGDIEQGIMVFFATGVFTLLYWLFYSKEPQVAELQATSHKPNLFALNSISKRSLLGIGMVAAFSIILSLPFLLAMLPYLNSSAFSVAQQNSGVAQNMLWADNLASFFLPSYYNGIFNSISKSYLPVIYGLVYQGATYQIDIAEKVSYIGYSVMMLSLLAIYSDFKQNGPKRTPLWIAFMFVFGWLSLGPYLQVYSSVTSIPSIYLLYKAVPLLNIIREPGRFDIIVTICLGIMAAFGFEILTRSKDQKTKYKYLAVVAAIILIEYNGMPLSSSFANSLITSAHIPLAYSQIGKLPGSFSVLMLPALANASEIPAQYIGMETYYTTATLKPLAGGYTSRENSTQSLAVSSVPLVSAASYLEQGFGLIYPSPISENYSNATLLFLANYNTSFISVLRPAYNLTEQEVLYSYLSASFGQPVYQSNTTFVFSTSTAISKNAGKSLVAYTVGSSWIPGYTFCNPYAPCDANVSTMWWGNDTRDVILFSPSDQNVAMSMIAIAPINGTVLSVYLNGNPYGQVTLRSTQYEYAINMTVPSGFSDITFFAQSNPSQPSPYFGYGIRNITFTK